MQNSFLKYVVSVEYLTAAILVAVFYVTVGGFAWYWLPISFFLFDISLVGYLISKHIGALTYNLIHSLVGPVILTLGYIVIDSKPAWLFIVLLWLFHIFVERALGMGLKHSKGLHHTHLGPIGKASKTKKKSRR